MSLAVSEAFSLKGIVSFDFLVNDGSPLLLEVNPRPGATLDVFDDSSGTLFKAHIEASRGGDPAALLASEWHPPVARGAAFLYADRGPLAAQAVDWPEWSADRPRPGSTIGAGQPLATVLAEGQTVEGVLEATLQRLGGLETLLYDTSNDQGTRQ
jgi:predicted ATP-grasp superfamily ATP-dependent carboligase